MRCLHLLLQTFQFVSHYNIIRPRADADVSADAEANSDADLVVDAADNADAEVHADPANDADDFS